jgi:hypothetical protein
MKHNTHIYLALKAIQLTRQSVDNTIDSRGRHLSGTAKGKERTSAVERQRILHYYQGLIEEASWAPDDILRDNDPFHIFKLFTDEEFPDHGLENKPKFQKDDVTYYKFAGGLPYRIDHIAQEIIDMAKLRDYNDQFDLRQIMYKYMLISHYVVDAHVPMHCDLRDDPPTTRRDPQPSRRTGSQKPRGDYMKQTAHNDLETVWDDAVTPVAVGEELIVRTWTKEKAEKTELSDSVSFGLCDCEKNQVIRSPIIPEKELMNFLIDVCMVSKRRGQELFPLEDPKERNDAVLPRITREIFADCIGNLMSVWRYIWVHGHQSA